MLLVHTSKPYEEKDLVYAKETVRFRKAYQAELPGRLSPENCSSGQASTWAISNDALDAVSG